MVAPAFVHRRVSREVPWRTVDEPQAELRRFRKARQAALQQLEQIQKRVSSATDAQTAQIFEFHRMMLQDA